MLRVTVLELSARWGDPLGAVAEVDAALTAGPATDLVLLPEASLTGYVSATGDFDIRRFAEPIGGPTARALAGLSQKHRATVVGPLVLEEGGRVHNAIVGFDPNGLRLFAYRKRHPWMPETWATAGRQPHPAIPLGAAPHTVKATACICFDIHFVSEEAGDTLDEADLLLFPSAWVDEGDDDRLSDGRAALLRDLAARHRIVIVNANWGPGLVGVRGQGASRIVSATGAEIARTPTSLLGWPEKAPSIARLDVTLELPTPRRASSTAP